MQQLSKTQALIFEGIEYAQGCPVKDKNPDSTFKELGMDSLDVYETVLYAQDKMGIPHPVPLENNMTVRGLAAILLEEKAKCK